MTKKIVIYGNECSDKKSLFTVTNVSFLFLTRYILSWTHKSAKNSHRALTSPLLPRATFSVSALWRHHNWYVTSREREKLVLWRHIRRLSLHAQIGAKAIFTAWINGWVNNGVAGDFRRPRSHYYVTEMCDMYGYLLKFYAFVITQISQIRSLCYMDGEAVGFY